MDVDELNHQRLIRPIRCIVKLGGAAITCKNEIEKINEESLQIVASQLREVMVSGSSSSKIIGMDWSKRAECSDISLNLDDFGDQELMESSNFIVVHGAGSFGHFQASKSGVHKGGLNRPLVKAGFVATRISVTKLNLEIVRALARESLPAIGMSPFSCGWSTCERNFSSANLSAVSKALDSSFIPVLHGDAVLDESQGCTILSGDVIIRYLAEHLKPAYVVFLVSKCVESSLLTIPEHPVEPVQQALLTDVLGVYDRPPSEPGAVLLREIAVKEDGSWSVLKPRPEDMSRQVEITVAAHDTTGGMMTKISEAAMIAKLGIDVYIMKATTSHSVRALRGDLRGGIIPEDWLGTLVRFST